MMRESNGLPAGSKIEEYVIDSILGAGGFGITYKAKDSHLDAWVAIKEYFPSGWSFRDHDGVTIHPNAQSELESSANTEDSEIYDYEWGLDRFLDEARALARIDHPNVVRIRRFFCANNTAYIVMDYEAGEPLSKLLSRRGIIPQDDLLKLLDDILGALQAVHDKGYLHRDIKPSNIYLRARDGCAMLIDFGAARMAMGQATRVLTGLVTQGYSPPEQYATNSENYGSWSDIYALGAVLYRCITGLLPPAASERLLDDKLKSALEFKENGYSEQLLALVDHALRVRPEQRYQSVAELRSDFADALAESRDLSTIPKTAQDYRTRVIEPLAQAPKPVQQSSRLAARLQIDPFAFLGGVAAVLTLTGGAFWFLWPQQETVPTPPRYILQDGKIVENSDKALSSDMPGAGQPPESVAPIGDDPVMPFAEGSERAADIPVEPSLAADATDTEVQKDIERLLALAHESRQENRLTRPLEQSAVYYYQQVLQLDSDNVQASQGLAAVVSAYLDMAQAELNRARFDRARTFIERGLTVDPSHPDLLVLLDQVRRQASIRRREPPSPDVVSSQPDIQPARDGEEQGFNRK